MASAPKGAQHACALQSSPSLAEGRVRAALIRPITLSRLARTREHLRSEGISEFIRKWTGVNAALGSVSSAPTSSLIRRKTEMEITAMHNLTQVSAAVPGANVRFGI